MKRQPAAARLAEMVVVTVALGLVYGIMFALAIDVLPISTKQ